MVVPDVIVRLMVRGNWEKILPTEIGLEIYVRPLVVGVVMPR
jgi:hypothetical protein